MAWYILYPKNKKEEVKLLKRKPTRRYWNKYGFSEGPYKNLTEVKKRLNQMDITQKRRPENVQDYNYNVSLR